MKAFASIVALATAAVVAAPASAQVVPGGATGQGTPYNNGATFGNNNGTITGLFSNVFTFIVTQAGTLTSSFSNAGQDGTNTDIDFATGIASNPGAAATLTGPAGFSTVNYARVLNDPLPETWAITTNSVNVGVGTYTLTVNGRALGSQASYAGTFLVTTGAGAVPEPAAWAMMIGGVGLAGASLRRRKQSKHAFA